MSARYPDFFIVGAMKCATSSLHEQLAAIPGIFMSEPKEPNFFSDDAVFSRGQDWYRGLFSAAAAGDLLGESSTHYAKLPTYPQTVARLSACVSAPKVIYVMRHPVERLVSQYIHEWSQGVISRDIDRAIVEHPELLHYSRYHYQILPYIQAFGLHNVLPVFFERLKRFPDAELQRICDFIGYAGAVSWRSDLKPSNVSRERIRKFPLYDLLVQTPLMQSLRRRLVPQAVRSAVKRRLTMKDRPALSRESWNRVTGVLDKDMAQLGQLFSVRLSCSNFRELVTGTSLDWCQRSPLPQREVCAE